MHLSIKKDISQALTYKEKDIGNKTSPCDYPPREFSTEPNTQNPIPELSLKIVLCKASSSPSAQYRWTKDGTYITEYNALDYSHRMLSVNRTDAGIYRCIAKNYLGAIRSKGTKIVIAYIDNFESHTTQTVNVLSGDGVVINLPSINSVPDPAVSWYASGVKMAQEAQRHQVTLEKNLVLLSTGIHSYNGKMYKAVALNGINGVSRTTKEFALRVGDTGEGVTKPPTLLVGPKNTTAETGNRYSKLECIYNARPLSGLQTKWYKKGSQRTEIVANNKYIFNTVYKRVLTIIDPDLSDAGQYECEAVFVSNGQSSTKTSDAYLTVNEAPLITSQIQSQYLRDFGQSIQVDCLATGNPPPTITWYFNAQPVSSVGNIRLSVTQSGSLKIDNLELSDAGVYQCFASNTAGETKISTWIKVDQSPPMFISSPLNLTLVEGADARFPCEVSGAPTPVIIWNKKLDSIESEVTTGGRYQISPTTKELLIITAETSDSALFSCNASNSHGSIYAEANLNVYQRTQITQPPLAFTELEKGSVASLQCGVSHDVNVNITWKWYQGVVELNPSARVTIEQDGTLTILGVYCEDNGVYRCQVLSAGGNDERSANLKVIDVSNDENLYEYVYAFGGAVVFGMVLLGFYYKIKCYKSQNIIISNDPGTNQPSEVNEIENVYDEIDELALDDMNQQPQRFSSSIEDDSSNSSGTNKSGTSNNEGYLNPYQPIIHNTDTHTYSLTSAAVSSTDEKIDICKEMCNQIYVNVKQDENTQKCLNNTASQSHNTSDIPIDTNSVIINLDRYENTRIF
ncbi:protein sidekick-2-like [Mytilus trossulus]|uniref:protein sidekick-2-like n=1 Tax=Mytilus trossulus TaxID=6551 RepID=UPI003003FB1F